MDGLECQHRMKTSNLEDITGVKDCNSIFGTSKFCNKQTFIFGLNYHVYYLRCDIWHDKESNVDHLIIHSFLASTRRPDTSTR